MFKKVLLSIGHIEHMWRVDLMTLPKPLRKQREVLYLPSTGHSVVLGTAGSGKTTLALYRAAFLGSDDLPHYGKVLLLTFNQALVTYLNYLKPREFRNVTIESYHKFARGYLNSRNKMSFNCICDPNLKQQLIEQSVENISSSYKPHKFFKRSLGFFVDEIQWLHAHGISDLKTYKKVIRTGRTGTRLNKDLRKPMFEILEEYHRLRDAEGKLYDWDDISTTVREEFDADGSERLYKHIIVDEGQDFSPEMIRSLASAIPSDGSLTLFGDVAQQIYGQRTSWRYANLAIQKEWWFEENYRNTYQIANLGLAISNMEYFSDVADMVTPKFTRPAGPLPTLYKCSGLEEELEMAVKVARSEADTKSVAVLFKNREQEAKFSKKLIGGTQLHRNMGSWSNNTGVFYGTYHSAKGLEFDLVILPFLNQDNLPDEENIEALGHDDALTHTGRLLYVAVTRAKNELILLYSNKLTELLPRKKSLYQVVKA